jgi:guanylate kinase
MLFVISAPSGAGKTTIARSILQRFPEVRFSISATTRAPRPREIHGRDYFFLSREDFQSRIAEGGLIEYEEIYGNLYGTLRSQIEETLRDSAHMLFDIDVKGALSIKKIYGEQSVLIFIMPPGLDVLRERLNNRGADSEDVIERRMQRAAWEVDQAIAFDHVVVNDDLKRSIPEVEALIESYWNRIV